ncbi:ribonuclease D, partial [bacterium]|nr:ribonuclease D [candidate division CSSED10-310 bacterium]
MKDMQTETNDRRDIVWVDTRQSLVDLLETVGTEGEMAVDTEADSLHLYRDRVCLIQVSTTRRDWIVDLLADVPLDSLWRCMEDPGILHVFHDADFDLRSLDRDYGLRPRSLFDTKIAAELLGRESLGLSGILQETMGVSLSKQYQKYPWSRRPVDPKARLYAAMDTRYLHALKNRFRDDLIASSRWEWAVEEFEHLESCRWLPSRRDRLGFWSIAGIGRFGPQQREMVRRIWDIREAAAAKRNVPPFKLFTDAALMGWISANDPSGVIAPGITPSLRSRIVTAMTTARSLPDA